MADWGDKYNTLKVIRIKVSDTKIWKCALEEHKTKGTLQLNVRLWTVSTTEGGYSGVTKNGFILPITSEDDLDKINDLFKELQNFTLSIKEFL